MDNKSTVDRYIDHINDHILPFVDYDRLQKSYATDMVYAKGILNRLHEAMVQCYGIDRLDMHSGDEGFVLIPGVVHGKESGNVYLALLDLDLSSSGEHFGTEFFCEHGVVSQSRDVDSPAMNAIWERIGSYDYCYTATIPGDIHIDKSRLPDKLKSIMADFHVHREVFAHENTEKRTRINAPPEIEERKAVIKFKPMSDWCMSKDYNGAERFHDGSRPLIGETKFADIIVDGVAGDKHKA